MIRRAVLRFHRLLKSRSSFQALEGYSVLRTITFFYEIIPSFPTKQKHAYEASVVEGAGRSDPSSGAGRTDSANHGPLFRRPVHFTTNSAVTPVPVLKGREGSAASGR